MNVAGRPLQRSGSAPQAADLPLRVELGGPLSGLHIQALDAPLQVSWNGKDWLTLAAGVLEHFRVSAPFVLVRSAGAPARYSVLGVLA